MLEDWGGATDSIQGYLHENEPDALSVALAIEELGRLAGAHLSERGHNDLIAVGCLCALRRGGVKIPEEIALIGCDALPEGRFQEFSLTTLRQPIPTMCQQAVERLLGLMQGEPGPQPRQIVLTPELVQGHTT
jgi:hypothetical protein